MLLFYWRVCGIFCFFDDFHSTCCGRNKKIFFFDLPSVSQFLCSNWNRTSATHNWKPFGECLSLTFSWNKKRCASESIFSLRLCLSESKDDNTRKVFSRTHFFSLNIGALEKRTSISSSNDVKLSYHQNVFYKKKQGLSFLGKL